MLPQTTCERHVDDMFGLTSQLQVTHMISSSSLRSLGDSTSKRASHEIVDLGRAQRLHGVQNGNAKFNMYN
jgi:hypothetical protein